MTFVCLRGVMNEGLRKLINIIYIYIYVSLDIYDPEPILRIKTSITSEEIG